VALRATRANEKASGSAAFQPGARNQKLETRNFSAQPANAASEVLPAGDSLTRFRDDLRDLLTPRSRPARILPRPVFPAFLFHPVGFNLPRREDHMAKHKKSERKKELDRRRKRREKRKRLQAREGRSDSD
jgi:hypothetical protein